nr:unnamed protein product [Callosobruchus chinensis]
MKMITLDEADIKTLCHKARNIFMSQPMLLELEAPIKICGELYIFVFFINICPKLNVKNW